MKVRYQTNLFNLHYTHKYAVKHDISPVPDMYQSVIDAVIDDSSAPNR